MKKNILIIFLSFNSILFAQTTNKKEDIQKLLTVLRIKNTMQSMVSQGIELYKKQKPAVSGHIWEEIKNSVDYNPYMTKVSAIFDINYSQAEIKHLIVLAAKAKQGKQPKFTSAVKEQLYNAGYEFGKNFANKVNQQLKLKGYY